ncbi:MAG: class I SAM-dependent methyltransferase [Ktedonobacteraceae bacterium]|nr:class I SAM-dependent methyltransferase [Ktedonobacteraceae bacterium]
MAVKIKEFYQNGEYLQKNPDWHVEASPWKAQTVLRMIRRNGLEPRSVCEIGCGAGEILKILQQELDPACTFDGYEIAPQAYALAKQRENERLHVHLADFLQERNVHFDLILIIDVLEHFENCFSVLRDIKDKSSYKIFLLPLDVSVFSVLHNELIDYRHATGHLHFFTKDVILEVIQDAGYEVLDTFYAQPPLDPTPWQAVKGNPRRIARKGIRLLKRGLQRLPGRLLYPLHQDLAVRIFGGWRLLVLAR